jgi:hypothetical protein
MADGMTQQVEAALSNLQRYLQDEIPPTAAADAVATLLARPPEVLMQQVAAWSESSAMQNVAVSDLLLHVLRKVFVTGELNLLDREAVANYLDRAMTIALKLCPVEEREKLRANLTAMRMSHTTSADRIPIPVIPARIPTLSMRMPALDDEEALNARRLSMILERLTSQIGRGGSQFADTDAQAAAQILTMAATSSRSGQQFNEYLEQIQRVTGGKEGNVFVILGGGLPSWDIPMQASSGLKLPAQIGAMEKIIDLAENPAVALQRLRDLLSAAVAKFNQGSLAAAMWMFDVVQTGMTEKKLDPATIDQILAEAVEKIDPARLKEYAENRNKHAALRIALEFFPTYRLPALFRQLRGEQRAERRRSLLGLIEIFGQTGRELALQELESELKRPDKDTYYLRNTIYLLHRIPRESDEGIERLLEALTTASARGQSIYVIREASQALSQIKTEASVKLLTTRLAEFEVVLLRSDTTVYPMAQMQKLLDRIISSIARTGTPAALLTVARHGMKDNPLLGDTRERLGFLAQYDLSFDEATVEVLLKALREELPGKFLGRLMNKKQDSTVRLIEALSGTRSDVVEEVLRDIGQRFPDQDIGRSALEVLEKWSAALQPGRTEPAATFAGELEFFGLPSVMQSLADTRATGILTLSTKQGQTAAEISLLDGKFLDARRAHIRGIDAFYETVEHPNAGRFAFMPRPAEKMNRSIDPRDVLSLLFEGVRRHDELQVLMTVVPDDLALTRNGNAKPTPPEDESDPSLMREVWLKASSGTGIGTWQQEVATDSFRIRRLVAHWLETGALIGK